MATRDRRNCNQTRSLALLTEQEVARSWGQVFKNGKIELGAFDRAEQLLDELRAESPLRHRLTVELEEMRNIHSRQSSVAAHSA
jgi:predicted DNA-binding WGR domain protein